MQELGRVNSICFKVMEKFLHYWWPFAVEETTLFFTEH